MKNTYSIIIVCLILFNANLINAQQETTIEISPYIGDKLDRIERDYFGFLPRIEGFQEAVFYLNPDSSLKAVIKYEEDEILKDTILSKYRKLYQIRNYVEQFIQYQINNIEKEDRGEFAICNKIDSSKISGELLSAEENNIMMLCMTVKSYENNEKDLFTIEKIKEDSIVNIRFEDEGWNAAFIIYPVVGMLLGGVFGATFKDDDRGRGPGLFRPSPKFWTTLAGALIGYLVGLSISIASPIEVGSDAVYESPFNEEDLEGLRDKSRYKDEEPYFLTKIRNTMK